MTYNETKEGNIEEFKEKSYSKLVDCQKKYFSKTIDEQRYFQNTVKRENQKLLCFDDSTLNKTIEGNIQSRKIFSRTNSYLSLQVFRCRDKPYCKSKDEIDKWLYNKQLEPLAFNKKPALKSYEQELRLEFE